MIGHTGSVVVSEVLPGDNVTVQILAKRFKTIWTAPVRRDQILSHSQYSTFTAEHNSDEDLDLIWPAIVRRGVEVRNNCGRVLSFSKRNSTECSQILNLPVLNSREEISPHLFFFSSACRHVLSSHSPQQSLRPAGYQLHYSLGYSSSWIGRLDSHNYKIHSKTKLVPRFFLLL